ncbi:MAG: hypothetical protein J6U10_05655 [Lachnospiraceae bacterium]|nr:hypothetical protein [Lachnospiraceae bacterium]
MKKILTAAVLLALCCSFATACTKDPGKINEISGTPGETVTSTPTFAVTDTPTPTVTLTPTSTPTPTPTLAPPLSIADMVVRSRELHEAVRPKTVANPLGTAPEYSAWENNAAKYGLTRERVVSIIEDDKSSYTCFCVAKIKNETVAEKINQRLKEVCMDMSDPAYLPDSPGYVLLFRDNGPSKLELSCECNEYQGILSVRINGYWTWEWNKPYGARTLPEQFETVCLNFDLRTGEELSLSDLFPEGFDYLGYLNKELEEISKYDYWYSESWYNDDYDPSKEYDGGKLPLQLKGDEQFFLPYSGEIQFFIEGKEAGYISLPFTPPDRGRGEKLCTEEYSHLWYLGSLSTFSGARIGEFRISSKGSKNPSVTVYADEQPLATASIPDSFISEYLSNEKILSYAKQLTDQWTGNSLPYDEIQLYCNYVTLWPNDYYCIQWQVEGWLGGSLRTQLDVYTYAHEGKILSLDEIFDIPFENLLAELISSLRKDESKFAEGEAAEEVAKALRPYFVGLVCEPLNLKLYDEWSWHNCLYQWMDGGYIKNEGPSGNEIKGLNPSIPAELRNDLTNNFFDSAFRCSDPYVIIRHLKMYKGLPVDWSEVH